MCERIKITYRCAVLDAADLRLSEAEPSGEHFLRNPFAAIQGDVEGMLAVCPGNAAHMLRVKGVTELIRIPEVGRYLGRLHTPADRVLLTGTTMNAHVLARKARTAALAVARDTGGHRSTLTCGSMHYGRSARLSSVVLAGQPTQVSYAPPCMPRIRDASLGCSASLVNLLAEALSEKQAPTQIATHSRVREVRWRR